MTAFPTITDYLLTIEQEYCFSSIKPEFLRDKNHKIIYTVGNSTLILKVRVENTFCCLKLFTSFDPQRSLYYKTLTETYNNRKSILLPVFKYIENEVNVYFDGETRSYPALLTEWVEGTTLNDKIKYFCTMGLKNELKNITNQFITLAKELVNSEITHIDLKPDNIIVCEDKLRLIDIDALYLPGYSPKVVTEQGTVWYKHPKRKEYTYDKCLHDYPILIILLSLIVIEEHPELYEQHTNDENIIFSPVNILKGNDKAYTKVKELYNNSLYKELIDSVSSQNVRNCSLEKLLNIIHYIRLKKFHTEATEEELLVFDEYVNISENIFAIKYSSLWGFMSKDGNMLTPVIFTQINRASESKIVLKKDNLWHIYTLDFILLSSFEAEDATFFSQNLLAIKRNGKWGYIDINCEIIIDFKYDYAQKFKDNKMATVTESGVVKEINIRGK